MRLTVVLSMLASACIYSPDSLLRDRAHSIRAGECLDVSVQWYPALDSASGSATLDVRIGNRCLRRVLVDYAALSVAARYDDGSRAVLSLSNPRGRATRFTLDGARAVGERFEFDNRWFIARDAPVLACLDVALLAGRAAQSAPDWVCVRPPRDATRAALP